MALLKKSDEITKRLEKSALLAVSVLSEIAANETVEAKERIKAANLILDRCFGRPNVSLDVSQTQLDAATIDKLLAQTSRAVMIDNGKTKIAISAPCVTVKAEK